MPENHWEIITLNLSFLIARHDPGQYHPVRLPLWLYQTHNEYARFQKQAKRKLATPKRPAFKAKMQRELVREVFRLKTDLYLFRHAAP